MRVVILGATGMLGQAVHRESLHAGLEVVPVSRASGTRWDFFKTNFESLALEIGLDADDVVVNCIGWIPQKKTGLARRDELDAFELNVELVREIQSRQESSGFSWVQIVTDCVFSGDAGLYSEDSLFDPIDLYGSTKSLGETLMPGAMRIRSSIVGPDPVHGSGLYEWFKAQPKDSRVHGFSNHIWNGVSTKAFGRLVAGLSQGRKVQPGIQHWIPLNSISKHDLLLIFRAGLRRDDVSVEEFDSGSGVNRVLRTVKPEANFELWSIAGYQRIPSIEELVSDFIRDDLKESRYGQ